VDLWPQARCRVTGVWSNETARTKPAKASPGTAMLGLPPSAAVTIREDVGGRIAALPPRSRWPFGATDCTPARALHRARRRLTRPEVSSLVVRASTRPARGGRWFTRNGGWNNRKGLPEQGGGMFPPSHASRQKRRSARVGSLPWPWSTSVTAGSVSFDPELRTAAQTMGGQGGSSPVSTAIICDDPTTTSASDCRGTVGGVRGNSGASCPR
jgi:hypothetical protein